MRIFLDSGNIATSAGSIDTPADVLPVESSDKPYLEKALKGQMHHHDDLGSKCAYMCHLSNKTTRKSVLLSTPQIWLMKVSKKTSLSLGIEAAIIRSGAYEVTVSTASDWLRDISGSH